MAYEELPNWLKPGIINWSKSTIKFDNGCTVSAEATSESSGRGGSCNVLICDEFAFLRKSMEAAFIQSVFPIISSSKTTKIIIVSTPNGMDNEFYRIYSIASHDKNNHDPAIWHAVKIMWNEVPGRDENWKKQQLETFGGNEAKFNQEFGCSFLGNANTLMSSDTLSEMKHSLLDRKLKPLTIQLHKDNPDIKLNVWYPPQQDHTYVVGADPSMGTGDDYQALCVLDITNAFNIKQVAGFHSNTMNPKKFAYMVAKTAMLYCNAYVMIEANGCSQVVLNSIWNDFEYENIVSYGTKEVGIYSNANRKADACLMFKRYLEDENHSLEINDFTLMNEIEIFEKISKPGKLPMFGSISGHDDYAMALIWAYSILNMELLDQYYYITKVVCTSIGEKMAYTIQNCDTSDPELIRQRLKYLDEKIKESGLDLEYSKRIESINTSNDAMAKLMLEDSTMKILNPEDAEAVESPNDQFEFGAFS